MKDPTQEEKAQAMENMECWSTQEHLKECRKCAPVGNWKDIEEEFNEKFPDYSVGSHDADCECYKCNTAGISKEEALAFFKPYFQEQRHEESVRELEEEHPLYKKEYNELPEIVDNSKLKK